VFTTLASVAIKISWYQDACKKEYLCVSWLFQTLKIRIQKPLMVWHHFISHSCWKWPSICVSADYFKHWNQKSKTHLWYDSISFHIAAENGTSWILEPGPQGVISSWINGNNQTAFWPKIDFRISYSLILATLWSFYHFIFNSCLVSDQNWEKIMLTNIANLSGHSILELGST
jgi:hypothetical protein